MPRSRRIFISREDGSHHIYSRVVGKELLLGDREKEYMLGLLERLSRAFFVEVHGFALMSNHFHLIVTEKFEQARAASPQELLRRYRQAYGEGADPPEGRLEKDGSVVLDEDGGIGRLRARLGSIGRFVQEFKQGFSRWYNRRHDRKGYLWADRYGDKVLQRGDHELVVRSYIDLNPVRAGVVKLPESYRWSGLGLRVRNPRRSRSLLLPLPGAVDRRENSFAWYREYVYAAGMIDAPGKAALDPDLVRSVAACHGRLGIGDKLCYRARNLTEGLALGGREFIEGQQRQLARKFVRARPLWKGSEIYTTRVLGSS